jgi:hypothetical protein
MEKQAERRRLIMANMTESEIKTECMEDLSTTIEIVGKSNHPKKDRIIASLETIDVFCDKWWEV